MYIDKDIDISKDVIDSILQPLGLYVYWCEQAEWWIVQTPNNEHIVELIANNYKTAYRFSLLRELLRTICESTVCFEFMSNVEMFTVDTIPNPYLGCHSLEEVLIRKDLMYG